MARNQRLALLASIQASKASAAASRAARAARQVELARLEREDRLFKSLTASGQLQHQRQLALQAALLTTHMNNTQEQE